MLLPAGPQFSSVYFFTETATQTSANISVPQMAADPSWGVPNKQVHIQTLQFLKNRDLIFHDNGN